MQGINLKQYNSNIQHIILDAHYHLHCLLEVAYHHCCRVTLIILTPLMDASLGEEGSPADRICTFYIRSWIVSNHKETASSKSFFHVVLDKLKSQLLRLTKVEFIQLKRVSFAVLLQHVVEWTKS
jgi:hypothetical protein